VGDVDPYRRNPATVAPEAALPSEEWMLAALLAVLGGARVVIAIVQSERCLVDVTLAGLVGVIGLVLLGQLVVRTLQRS